MPLRFVLDENLRGPLWRSIERHNQSSTLPIEVIRVGDESAPPLGTSDADLLIWAEEQDRVLVTHDKSTIPHDFAEHLSAGRHSPGVITLRRAKRISDILAYLVLAAHASEPWEWQNRIHFIPE